MFLFLRGKVPFKNWFKEQKWYEIVSFERGTNKQGKEQLSLRSYTKINPAGSFFLFFFYIYFFTFCQKTLLLALENEKQRARQRIHPRPRNKRYFFFIFPFLLPTSKAVASTRVSDPPRRDGKCQTRRDCASGRPGFFGWTHFLR